ncbi:ArsR/SmtB family transcription factor [Streptomyces qinzhouensis]|uniref:Helix-turn-helix transcriptional regulator n=1 Tax=Streptomyces qinzhouensis TaxID=2599401 RepID=A0A5B8JE20_9ACTN|nr:helix-turn-helix domain-containing protein [Streptomyces qinzhouensis]QDY79646.1 helix-turn-helix transcriptional regulator [Streptomyces qinzhouensis]
MLRIHFTESDLARTRRASSPDPLWETVLSLHRLQTRRGRWAFAEWHRVTTRRLTERGLGPLVRTLLLPALPRARYFPDFLTPPEASEGLQAGLEAILATPRTRAVSELDRLVGTDSRQARLRRLADAEGRTALVHALHTYHSAAIAPYTEHIASRLGSEHTLRTRAMLDGGIDGLLTSLAPAMRWRPPVLELLHHTRSGDVYLDGRGLTLIPSYFCWHSPVTIADPRLPQVLVYPVLHPRAQTPPSAETRPALGKLIGRSRAGILAACASGATSTELIRATGLSAGSISLHTRALREAGIIDSHRHAVTVLHTLTPLGAALLRRNQTHPRPPAV